MEKVNRLLQKIELEAKRMNKEAKKLEQAGNWDAAFVKRQVALSLGRIIE